MIYIVDFFININLKNAFDFYSLSKFYFIFKIFKIIFNIILLLYFKTKI